MADEAALREQFRLFGAYTAPADPAALTFEERLRSPITDDLARLVQSLSVNDDSVSASFTEAGSVGLEDSLKIRVSPESSVPQAMEWLRPTQHDRAEAEGPPQSLGALAGNISTVAREVPAHPDANGATLRRLPLAERMKMLLPIVLRCAMVDVAYTKDAMMTKFGTARFGCSGDPRSEPFCSAITLAIA